MREVRGSSAVHRWRRIGVVVILVCSALVSLWATTASAEGEAVQAKLQVEDDEGVRQPVPGVAFTVSQSGSEVGTGTTGDDGLVNIPVPAAGEYDVTLEVDTLPEGVSLKNADRSTISAAVEVGRPRNMIFALERDDYLGAANNDDSMVRRVAQLTVDGLKLGLYLAMAAIGLSLIFGTTGLVNFAHSEMIAFGYFTAYLFNLYGFAGFLGFMKSWPPPFGDGVNLIFATIIAVIFGAVFGWVLDTALFAPLRRMGVPLIAQLVVTIGLSLFLRYLFFLAFGGTQRFYRDYTAQKANTYFGLIRLENSDLLNMVISVLVLISVGLVLSQTRIGKAMRAVADNRDLAESSGIDVQRVIRYVWVAGGALAALGGVFLAISETVNYLLGFRMLLLIFAGVTLGGLGTTYGALVGCVLVGMGISLSTLFIPIELKNVGALLVLIVVLMIRPQGLLGKSERIG